jgi:type I restriction enzyme S subunit
LGELTDVLSGFAFDSEGFNDSGGLPIVRIRDVVRGTTSTYYRGAFASQYLIDNGDILIGMDGEFNRARWRGGKALLNQRVCRIASSSADLDDSYLFHFLPGALKAIEHVTPYVTVKHLSVKQVREIAIPLPPLAEQRRIAEILDKADALRAKRRAALAQLDTLTQSIFLDMFGDPDTNPKGWPLKRIAEMTECLDRLRRPVTESDRRPGNVPYYGANGQQGWIDKALFDELLVLVAEDGGYFDAPERGVAYRIDGPAWVNNHAHILRALPKYVETEFLHRALRHFNFLPYISGTTRAKLTQGQLNSVKVFVPPLELQRTFGERVASVQRIAREAIDSGEQLDALFASLQYRAFRGDLHLGREQPTLAMMG